LISLLVSPAAIRAEMNRRIRFAIGAVDWSSVVLHVGAHHLALEVADRRVALARSRRRRQRQREGKRGQPP